MQVQAVSLPFAHLSAQPSSSSAAKNSSTTSAANPVDDTNSMFMKLLTAQLQNQSPLDPVDPMQFTTQLVQFNMLSQLTQINAVLQQTVNASAAGVTGAVANNSGGN
jgi:flagellar basal-body rod modification protein FlgD